MLFSADMGLIGMLEEKWVCLQHRLMHHFRIYVLVALGLGVFLGETVIAYLSQCITLSADAFHVLTEAGILLIGFISKRYPQVNSFHFI